MVDDNERVRFIRMFCRTGGPEDRGPQIAARLPARQHPKLLAHAGAFWTEGARDIVTPGECC